MFFRFWDFEENVDEVFCEEVCECVEVLFCDGNGWMVIYSFGIDAEMVSFF